MAALEDELRVGRAARLAAERAALEASRVLGSERGWVASLDAARLRDLATIRALEARLEQWRALHEPGEGVR